MSMDYRGLNLSSGISSNNTISNGPIMMYRREWDPIYNYVINDFVFYQEKSYVAINDSRNVEPGTDPIYWDLVSFWSNLNNVSNFRGKFASNVRLQKYDSMQDPTTFITYTWQGNSIYNTTTLANMIQDLVVLAPSPYLLQQTQTPCYCAFTGNGTAINGGLLFPSTITPPQIIESDMDFQTIRMNQGFRKQGTTTVLDGSTLYAKEGLYNVSCSILMWVYDNRLSSGPPFDWYKREGYFEIVKVDAGGTRTGIVRNQVGGPFKYNDPGTTAYYPVSIKLDCIIPLSFNEGVTLNCTNVFLGEVGFAIAPTINIKYLGPYFDQII
jgi:hypothetical protein